MWGQGRDWLVLQRSQVLGLLRVRVVALGVEPSQVCLSRLVRNVYAVRCHRVPLVGPRRNDAAILVESLTVAPTTDSVAGVGCADESHGHMAWRGHPVPCRV